VFTIVQTKGHFGGSTDGHSCGERSCWKICWNSLENLLELARTR
jgi:hypothetical protein